jgi:hypothetical protein
MDPAKRVKWLPPATIVDRGESRFANAMVSKASGERQVALAVTPMISGSCSEILLAKSDQGLSKVVQSRIWQGKPFSSRYAPRFKRPKEGVHILNPGKRR